MLGEKNKKGFLTSGGIKKGGQEKRRFGEEVIRGGGTKEEVREG